MDILKENLLQELFVAYGQKIKVFGTKKNVAELCGSKNIITTK